MAAGHGGARQGAGRKPKGQQPDPGALSAYSDPLAYLIAVACGEVKGDGLRVAAAKAALPYTQPKTRAPVESPAPRELSRKNKATAANDERAQWLRKAAEIRAKHRG